MGLASFRKPLRADGGRSLRQPFRMPFFFVHSIESL
jgi:hypothetical protein